MIHAKVIVILYMLLAFYSPIQAQSEDTEQLIITEAEFDLEQEILNASAAGLDTIRFQQATYIRETTINLSGISNMRIIFDRGSRILLDDIYENVVEIRDCERIEFWGGHFCHVQPPQQGYCYGSVFALFDSNLISINFCEILGCGSIGFFIKDCSSIEIANCKIRDNSTCAFYPSNVDKLYIGDCEITDNGELFSPGGSINHLWMIGNTIANNGMPYYP